MKHFPEKYNKKLPENFAETVQGMSKEEIEKKILESEGHLYEIEDDKNSNEKLLKAKEELKEMMAPYREAKGVETAKICFCMWVLENRGVELAK